MAVTVKTLAAQLYNSDKLETLLPRDFKQKVKVLNDWYNEIIGGSGISEVGSVVQGASTSQEHLQFSKSAFLETMRKANLKKSWTLQIMTDVFHSCYANFKSKAAK